MTTINYTTEELINAGTRECKECKNRYLLVKDHWHVKRGSLNTSKCKKCANEKQRIDHLEKVKNRKYIPMTEERLMYYRNYYTNHKVKVECTTCNIKLFKHNIKKHNETVSHKNKLETNT